MGSRLYYFGTRDEVRVGDRVRFKRLFFRDRFGSVVYIPGCGPRHPELGDDQWAIRDDDGATTWAIGYFPDQFQPPKKIVLLARGEAKPLEPTDRIDEWQTDDDEGAG